VIGVNKLTSSFATETWKNCFSLSKCLCQ